MRRPQPLFLLAMVVLLVTLACRLGDGDDGLPDDAVLVEVIANTSLSPWLPEVSESFNGAEVKTAAGHPVFVRLKLLEAGQAVADLSSGSPLPALWLPDSEVWVDVLAERGQPAFQGECASVAQSPLVIAVWQPIAEALGWPGRSLGWLDVGSLAADPSAWAYYSGGQFGPALRLGHTHPGLSGSGASALLAVVQAAQSKTEAVTATDIQQPIVQASVSAFEGSVSWFSPDTYQLGQTMRQRGSGYLGAAIVYESTVINFGGGDPAIVPIYPFEGTFIATHPACLNRSAGAETQEATRLFRDYLLEQAAQEAAAASGLRPVSQQAGPMAAPEKIPGLDLTQPKIIFDPPGVETIYAVQDVWQAARKEVSLVMLLDTSGSMEGDKMENMRRAAIQFVEQMGDSDFITIIAFSTRPVILIQNQQVKVARDEAISKIAGMRATGDTALYDAIGIGASLIAGSTSSQISNAMVVLSDGLDTSSYQYRFDQRLIETAAANDTTVFTIAYGNDADQALLTQLANQANGNFYLGSEANIAAIYQEMSAAFGGSVGIGR